MLIEPQNHAQKNSIKVIFRIIHLLLNKQNHRPILNKS